MQHHPGKRPAGKALAVTASLLAPFYQASLLQRGFHPRIAVLQPMLLPQFLMKVLHIEVKVLLPIKTEYLLQIRHWNTRRTRRALAGFPQSAIAVLLILLAPPPHGPVSHPDDLGGSHHFSLPAIAFRITSCIFITPLHLRGRELLFDGFHIAQLSPPAI